MVGSHARLHRGEDRGLAYVVDEVDGSTAVTDVHFAFRVEGDTGRDSKIACKLLRLLERSRSMDRPVVAAGQEHFTPRAESKTSGVGKVGQKGFALAVASNLVNRDWHFLTASTGQSRIDCSVVAVVRGVCYRMKILCQ